MFHPYSFYLQKHKNAKIKRESALPFFSFPLLLHLVIHTPNVQTACYYVPFRHLGCPISPFGVSHFAIWGIPFCLLGCPILPFGVSHFTIWGIFSAHLYTMYSHDFRFVFFVFSLPKFVFFLSFRFIMFLRDSLGRIKYIL